MLIILIKVKNARNSHNLFFFRLQGTFSLIVEAYHDADNSTHQSAGECNFFFFLLDHMTRVHTYTCTRTCKKLRNDEGLL